MDTLFMNSENSKTFELHILILKLTDKLDLRKSEKIFALSNLSIYYTWKNIKISCSNNKFKISAPTWNDKLELPDGSYSVSDIQGYFEYILKKHDTVTENPSIMIYVNKMQNKITFKMKKGYYLQLLTTEAMKLHGSIKSKVTENENGKNVSHLDITEVVLIYRNIVNNDYQQDSRVLYKFLPNKSFDQLLNILPRISYF